MTLKLAFKTISIYNSSSYSDFFAPGAKTAGSGFAEPELMRVGQSLRWSSHPKHAEGVINEHPYLHRGTSGATGSVATKFLLQKGFPVRALEQITGQPPQCVAEFVEKHRAVWQ